MILHLIALAAIADGNDPINLARAFKPGEVQVFRLSVSPIGKSSPLGNPFEIKISVTEGPIIVVSGAPSPYEADKVLAKWSPNSTGFPTHVQFSAQGFDFLPYAFGGNDSSLKPGEMEAVGGGSVKMLSDKDSVAQIKVWLPFGSSLLAEDSDVEVASRQINHASGFVYCQSGGRLEPTRTFSIVRLRTAPISPIPQEEGG